MIILNQEKIAKVCTLRLWPMSSQCFDGKTTDSTKCINYLEDPALTVINLEDLTATNCGQCYYCVQTGGFNTNLQSGQQSNYTCMVTSMKTSQAVDENGVERPGYCKFFEKNEKFKGDGTFAICKNIEVDKETGEYVCLKRNDDVEEYNDEITLTQENLDYACSAMLYPMSIKCTSGVADSKGTQGIECLNYADSGNYKQCEYYLPTDPPTCTVSDHIGSLAVDPSGNEIDGKCRFFEKNDVLLEEAMQTEGLPTKVYCKHIESGTDGVSICRYRKYPIGQVLTGFDNDFSEKPEDVNPKFGVDRFENSGSGIWYFYQKPTLLDSFQPGGFCGGSHSKCKTCSMYTPYKVSKANKHHTNEEYKKNNRLFAFHHIFDIGAFFRYLWCASKSNIMTVITFSNNGTSYMPYYINGSGPGILNLIGGPSEFYHLYYDYRTNVIFQPVSNSVIGKWKILESESFYVPMFTKSPYSNDLYVGDPAGIFKKNKYHFAPRISYCTTPGAEYGLYRLLSSNIVTKSKSDDDELIEKAKEMELDIPNGVGVTTNGIDKEDTPFVHFDYSKVHTQKTKTNSLYKAPRYWPDKDYRYATFRTVYHMQKLSFAMLKSIYPGVSDELKDGVFYVVSFVPSYVEYKVAGVAASLLQSSYHGSGFHFDNNMHPIDTKDYYPSLVQQAFGADDSGICQYDKITISAKKIVPAESDDGVMSEGSVVENKIWTGTVISVHPCGIPDRLNNATLDTYNEDGTLKGSFKQKFPFHCIGYYWDGPTGSWIMSGENGSSWVLDGKLPTGGVVMDESYCVELSRGETDKPFVNPPFFNIDVSLKHTSDYASWNRQLDIYKNAPITEIEKKIVQLTSVCDSLIVNIDGSGDDSEDSNAVVYLASQVGVLQASYAVVYTPANDGVKKPGGTLL